MSKPKEAREQKRKRHIREMKEQFQRYLGQSEPPFLGKFASPKEEEERLDWAKQFPEDVIPPHEPLPCDRDRHLPESPCFYTRPRDIS